MMMTLVESSLVVGFRSSGMPSSIASVGSCQPSCTISAAATTNDQITLYPGWCRFGSQASRTFISGGIAHVTNVNNRGLWRNGLMRRSDLLKGSVVRAAATEHSGSTPDPLERNAGIRQSYHPFEEIEESVSKPDSEEAARLSDAEMTRTMIEVNSKATLMFSGMIDDEVHDNVVWPGLPYVTDEHGDIYFKVDSDEGIMQTLASESNVVKVIIGLDNMGIFTEMGLPGQSDIDFGIEEITDEDSDNDDDHENDDEDDGDDDDDEDWVAILDDEEDEFDSSDTLGDWANLETMRSSHPLYFARRIAEVVSNPHSGCIDLPCTGLAIQGMLRPAFFEEQSTIQKNMTSHQTDEVEKEESIQIGTAFYKLEIITIQLVSAYGNQCVVNVEDFRRARPDVIAHSAANIISRLEAGGEKIVQALKSLCWRCKGIIVEEVALIGVDSLGFDLRVCSGTQVQTLRFAFDTRATSEYSAERQLHDLLFPRIHPKLQNCQEAHQKDG